MKDSPLELGMTKLTTDCMIDTISKLTHQKRRILNEEKRA